MTTSTVSRRYSPDMDCTEKRCTRCGDWWPDDIDFFYSNGHDGLMTECRACYKTRRQIYLELKKLTRKGKGHENDHITE